MVRCGTSEVLEEVVVNEGEETLIRDAVTNYRDFLVIIFTCGFRARSLIPVIAGQSRIINDPRCGPIRAHVQGTTPLRRSPCVKLSSREKPYNVNLRTSRIKWLKSACYLLTTSLTLTSTNTFARASTARSCSGTTLARAFSYADDVRPCPQF